MDWMQRIFVFLLATFAVSQVIALAIGAVFVAQQLTILENPEDPGNALTLMAYVLFSALAILLILKYYAGRLLFLAIELLLIFFSTQIVAAIFLPVPVAAALALAVAALRFAFPGLRQYAILYSTSVAGALLGASLGIVPAVAFAILLAAYDFAAVFYTKHMIALAEGLGQRGVAFSIQITASKSSSSATKINAKTSKKAKISSSKRRIESIELGTGDLVIPAMLMVSSLKLSLLHSFAGLAGALAGLMTLLWVMERRRGYFPALPPIVLGSFVGLALATLYLFATQAT